MYVHIRNIEGHMREGICMKGKGGDAGVVKRIVGHADVDIGIIWDDDTRSCGCLYLRRKFCGSFARLPQKSERPFCVLAQPTFVSSMLVLRTRLCT